VKYLLDTHTWYWWNNNPLMLSKEVLKLLEIMQPADEYYLSAISVWEIAKLIERGRIKLSSNGLTWIREALDIPRLVVVPLSPEISWESTNLPGNFHKDPADQIIVATARILDATLLSKDDKLSDYSGVRVMW